MKSFLNYFKEKTILNLIDNITLEGVGTVKCMADSGNSAFNVLDGRDIEFKDNKVVFTTTNKNIKLEKDVFDTITIHIGSGVNEKRPVMKFSIIYNNKKYLNVPFSIADRSKNETEVLLGREFLTKLDALIDVNS